MKLPKAFRDKLNQAQDFVRNPQVKSYAEIGTKILTVTAQIGQAKLNGPLSVAGLVVGAIDAFAKSGRNFYSEQSFLTKDMIELESKTLAQLLMRQGAFAEAAILYKDDDYQIKSLSIDGKRMIVLLSKSGNMISYFPVYVDKDFDIKKACSMLWESTGNYVVVCMQQDEAGYNRLTVAPLADAANIDYVIGENPPHELVSKFETYKQAGVTRAYRLDGPPGTGKTLYAFMCAKIMRGSLMVITPEILSSGHISKQDIIDLAYSFKPSVLLFDDVDRVKEGDLLLSLMDQIRRENKDTLILSTVNDSSKLTGAMKRPRRLGSRHKCPSPNLDLKAKIIDSHSKTIGLKRDIKHLSKYMDHSLFSHDYVQDVCEQALLDNDEQLIKYIKDIVEELEASDDKKVEVKTEAVVTDNGLTKSVS